MMLSIRSVVGFIVVAGAGMAFAFAMPVQAPLQEAVSSGQVPNPSKLPSDHGNGVTTKASVHLSDGVLTEDGGGRVRLLSYSLSFLGEGRVSLAKMHGLVAFDETSTEMLTESISGVFPGLMQPGQSSPPHGYTVNIFPRQGVTWSEATADDVIVDVVRTK